MRCARAESNSNLHPLFQASQRVVLVHSPQKQSTFHKRIACFKPGGATWASISRQLWTMTYKKRQSCFAMLVVSAEIGPWDLKVGKGRVFSLPISQSCFCREYKTLRLPLESNHWNGTSLDQILLRRHTSMHVLLQTDRCNSSGVGR